MLNELKNAWKTAIESVLHDMAAGADIPALSMGLPPKSEMGDVAFPMFPYAKALHKSPAAIASDVIGRLENSHPDGEMSASGPYLNVRFDIPRLADRIMEASERGGDRYGFSEEGKGRRVMVEFSCPNTNKPLHLGHMRNDSLGEAVSALIKATGAEVMKVNLINNRGVHISKSMLAYKLFGNGETPESTGEKGDHFVGRYYVRFAQWEKEAEEAKKNNPDIVNDPSFVDPDAVAQAMLRDWENGDPEVRALWEKMNKWTLDGLFESYRNMGISFDRLYFESDTYKLGRDQVMRGLDMGVFHREEDGSVQIDLAPIGLDKKVLLRRDGTTLYITQDLGTAVRRHEDWPFDSLIYVVASEQNYHFKVLFYVLKMLGYKWADELHHLSYGMVNLPEGKMKSREGTVVDADDLLEELSRLAENEIIEKGRENEVGDVKETARKIALGALNYYLLQVQPQRDMIFNPKESISFSGNTGPYLQYTCARISSILRRFSPDEYEGIKADGSLLTIEDEKILLKAIAEFPDDVRRAASSFDPSIIASTLYEIAKTFSHYYHDNQILKAETKELVVSRIRLISSVLTVMKNGFALIGIPFLESM